MGPYLARGYLVQPDPRPVAATAILFHVVVHRTWVGGGVGNTSRWPGS